MALVLLVGVLGPAGCAGPAAAEDPALLPATARPGQPPGSVEMLVAADPAQLVTRVQEAITANGGTVLAVLDHAAAAREQGVEVPANIMVVGGSPGATAPLVTAGQRAGVDLPQRYLVRQNAEGVSLTANGAGYVAASAGILDPASATALTTETAAVLGAAALDPNVPGESPLIGVTPAGYLLTSFGSANVPDTVARLRRNADRGTTRSVAALDLTAPTGRATSVVLVTAPAAAAALVARAPSIGLDLPLRFLIWVDEQNRTQIGYPDVRRIAARHGVPADDPAVVGLAADADRLARLAAGGVE